MDGKFAQCLRQVMIDRLGAVSVNLCDTGEVPMSPTTEAELKAAIIRNERLNEGRDGLRRLTPDG